MFWNSVSFRVLDKLFLTYSTAPKSAHTRRFMLVSQVFLIKRLNMNTLILVVIIVRNKLSRKGLN
jgi:hypothetical protein